jgi:hypothetical protein
MKWITGINIIATSYLNTLRPVNVAHGRTPTFHTPSAARDLLWRAFVCTTLTPDFADSVLGRNVVINCSVYRDRFIIVCF